ncbi:uncharacterized protein samd1b [Polyodon spathula]|uniref:uncharacterized protein samd1b n=1 Tax=Polyodon spathula TaxID=7913 RepID=UPI001B7DEF2C|nr:uncharacterized protein samd1b [Polyodon spathula]
MTEPKYREWILETIDSLRSRKARPDLERICRMVRRRHGSDPDRTRTELEKLIQDQTVLKVSYKGSISYRNAAKVQRKSRKKLVEPEAGGDSAAASSNGRTTGAELAKNASPALNSACIPAEIRAHCCKGTECPGEVQCNDAHSKNERENSVKDAGDVVPGSGNSCMCCGAAGCKSEPRNNATGCTSSSDANGPKDKKLQQTGCPSNDTSTPVNCGNNIKTRASLGPEPGVCRSACSCTDYKTCSHRHRKQAPLKKSSSSSSSSSSRRLTHKACRSGATEAKPDLGDRLVASVRSLAEKSGPSASKASHTPLGLKEILGFLSSQERLSQEKLTRSKVKVVLEREVAKGRLRRTRFGNITLPLRGEVRKSAARLMKPPPGRGGRKTKEEKVMEGGEEPMETDSCEEDPASVSEDQNPTKPPSEDQLEEPKSDVTGTEECNTKQVPPEEGDIKSLPMESPAAEQSSACQEAAPVQECNPSSPQTKDCSCETGLCNEEPGEEKKVLSSNNIPSEQSAESLSLSNIVKLCSSETSPPEECPTEASKTEEMPPELLDSTEEADPSPVETEKEAVCLPLHRALQSREEELQTELQSREEGLQTESSSILAGTAVEDEKMLHRECGTLAASVLSIPMESCGCAVEAGVAPCLLTPSASPGETEQRVLNGDVCVKVEKCGVDPVDWSVADVVSYFTAAGFGEQAGAFRNQEIDGKSLLLMQRSDVLKGLSIRLGPALKIYEFHIKVLQRSHFQVESALC